MHAPKYIELLVNGCVRLFINNDKYKLPTCIVQLCLLFYCYSVNLTLCNIKFIYEHDYVPDVVSNYPLFQKIPINFWKNQKLNVISCVVILNNTSYAMHIKCGTFWINICLAQSKINVNANVYNILKRDDSRWLFPRDESKIVEMTIIFTRAMSCSCNGCKIGDIQIYFSMKSVRERYLADEDDRRKGNLTKNWLKANDGIVKIQLGPNFNYFADNVLTVESYNVSCLDAYPNDNARLPCGNFGFGGQCCGE